MINSIHVKNYKCLIDKTINLSGLNFISGGNAVGKSSLIQCILLKKMAYENIDRKEVLVNDIFGVNLGLPKNLISANQDSTEISIEINEEDKDRQKVIFKLGDDITNPFSLDIENHKDILNARKTVNMFDTGFIYLNAERVGPRITSDMSSTKELNVGVRGEYTNHVINKADLLNIRVNKNMEVETLPRFSAQCEVWLNTIIPNLQLRLDTNEDVNKSTITYKNAGIESDYYVPTATGFGITYTLPIIVSGLLATNKPESILIIENPEAHLHPYGQSQMGKFLVLVALCGVQVIVETHSEHIINGARLQVARVNNNDLMKVIFFDRINKDIDIKEISVNSMGELDSWPKGFFDQNKVDLRELLGLRYE